LTVGATVTAQAAVLPPSTVVTVMVAVPAATAVTLPLVDTLATSVLLLLHVTFLLVVLEGVIVAVRVSVPPTARLIDDLFRDTPDTATVLPGFVVPGLVPPLPKPESQVVIEMAITTSRTIAQSILLCVPKSLNVFLILKAPLYEHCFATFHSCLPSVIDPCFAQKK